MISQIDPDKCAELLADQIKLYEKLVTKSKALSVGATKVSQEGRKKSFHHSSTESRTIINTIGF